MGPKYLIIKKGEHGAFCSTKMRCFLLRLCHSKMYLILQAPAIHLRVVYGHLAKAGIYLLEDEAGHYCRLCHGWFCVEKFGPTRLKEITKEDIDGRLQQFKELVSLRSNWFRMFN